MQNKGAHRIVLFFQKDESTFTGREHEPGRVGGPPRVCTDKPGPSFGVNKAPSARVDVLGPDVHDLDPCSGGSACGTFGHDFHHAKHVARSPCWPNRVDLARGWPCADVPARSNAAVEPVRACASMTAVCEDQGFTFWDAEPPDLLHGPTVRRDQRHEVFTGAVEEQVRTEGHKGHLAGCKGSGAGQRQMGHADRHVAPRSYEAPSCKVHGFVVMVDQFNPRATGPCGIVVANGVGKKFREAEDGSVVGCAAVGSRRWGGGRNPRRSRIGVANKADVHGGCRGPVGRVDDRT